MELYPMSKYNFREYNIMSNGKIKHWIFHHLKYINNGGNVIKSYNDHCKYNMRIVAGKKGFIIRKRFMDSVFEEDSKGNHRTWTKNHSYRKPRTYVIRGRYRGKNGILTITPVRVMRLKYKLGSIFEVARRKK